LGKEHKRVFEILINGEITTSLKSVVSSKRKQTPLRGDETVLPGKPGRFAIPYKNGITRQGCKYFGYHRFLRVGKTFDMGE
jgi:hypothetical protein